jgi:hypothetical protein
MKRTDIPNMTADECQDELVMQELSKLIRKARKVDAAAEEASKAVFQALDDMCIDIEAPSAAENADSLGDAVSCYIQYGEYSLKSLLSEIKTQYTEKEHKP